MGLIAPWYLKNYQFDIYELLLKERFPFIEKSRRIGGTTVCLVRVLEFLQKKELGVWRWMEPWKNQAREIVMPEIDRIQESCPESLKFRFYKTDSFYEHPKNGSRLYLRGVNDDRGESARGPFAHGLTADEYGSWKEADYILNEAMIPQLLSTNGPLWRVSSPPKNLGHLFYDERELAARERRFISKTILDAVPELYTEEQIWEMCKAVGGKDSAAWRREFMCEPVSDPESLIIPEWSEANIVDDDYPMPQFLDTYVAGDSGADDNTAMLFAYYNFAKNEIVVENEFVDNGRTTTYIIERAKEIERELWGEMKPYKRVYDADKQLLYDIIGDLKYAVMPPRKEDKIAAIHELRVEVQSLRFKVKRRCVNTIRQLKVGMWKDDKHTDFERTDGLGHLDAIAAAIYLNRAVDRTKNPTPRFHGFDPYTSHIPRSGPDLTQTDAAVAALFRPKRGFR